MATTGMGIASVTHHVIMSAATASTSFASCETANGLIDIINRNNAAPADKERRSRRLLIKADIKAVEYLLSLALEDNKETDTPPKA